ncbi:hypothetical protein D1B31_01690 [Neobacillus notoginsengisoli]|uniref:Uncharacterized protein n=1 Tax=Neobacillus notoginsengisoli TaxID=1578198 RepID=A0A417YZT2_9BACI|nr:hypothetical protein [Neobacillus notoginsengisoli]RHW43400.1 hypothetical protein D1B31_01690 [Neobacillus notoginsengisoli]
MFSGVGASFLFLIIFWIAGLFILYMIISTAVKVGINKSVIGRFIESKYGEIQTKKTFLDSDLDNEK